ncbi:hypothetical protein [Olleya sp. R77988]|uniref:hypothetical protein n=1 Tax=Olleya sp. R77988 TaxID=3093875 RepID=UPI0037C92528
MTIKDFFRISLKALGLLLIISVITLIPSFFLDISDGFGVILYYLFSIVLMVFVAFFIISKSDYVIEKLKLDSGFDNDLLKLNNIGDQKIIQIACVLIGLYIITSALPSVLLEAFQYFKYNASGDSLIDLPMHSTNYFYLQLVYFLLGLILIGIRKQISSFFK